jgi:hypothetical protein
LGLKTALKNQSFTIDEDDFNEAYSNQEKPLNNAEIKEFVEINGSNLDTKGLDNLSRLAVVRMSSACLLFLITLM